MQHCNIFYNPNLNKSTKKLLTGIGISALLIALIWWRLSTEDALTEHLQHIQAHFDGGNYTLIIVILLMAPMSWCIEAAKWRFILKKIQQISLPTAIASVLTGMSFAMVTPGKVGDFAGRILYLKENIRLRGTIATLVGSFAHIVVTFFLGTIGMAVVLTQHASWLEWTLFLTAITVGIGVALLFFNIHRLRFKPINKKSWLGKLLLALKILKRYDRKDLLKIVGLSFLKLCTYTTQFVLVTFLFGSPLSFELSFFVAAAMFWMIMIIPSFFVADVVVRGVVAEQLFVKTDIIMTSTPILAGTYIIWLINWVLPSIIGALSLMVYRLVMKYRGDDNDKSNPTLV